MLAVDGSKHITKEKNAIDDAIPYSMLDKADMVEYQRKYTETIGGCND